VNSNAQSVIPVCMMLIDTKNKVTFCHVPDGNPENAQTLTVGWPAYYSGGHDDHKDDYMGPCKANLEISKEA